MKNFWFFGFLVFGFFWFFGSLGLVNLQVGRQVTDLLAVKRLDLRLCATLALRNQIDASTLLAVTTRTANAVDVVLALNR